MTISMFTRVDWRRFGWKLLAAVFTLMMLNYWLMYDDPHPRHPLENVQSILNVVGVVGLWGLGFGFPLISRNIWKTVFVVDLVVFISCMAFLRTPGLETYNPVFLWALVLILFVPYYIALFVYGFKSSDIWKT